MLFRSIGFSSGLLFATFCLHNLEEALTYGLYRSRSEALISQIAGTSISAPTTRVFLLALAVVTLLGGVVAAWCARAPLSRIKRRVLLAFCMILGANVFLPHLPAAILLGGYAPGVLTAVAINLPVTVYVARRILDPRS